MISAWLSFLSIPDSRLLEYVTVSLSLCIFASRDDCSECQAGERTCFADAKPGSTRIKTRFDGRAETSHSFLAQRIAIEAHTQRASCLSLYTTLREKVPGQPTTTVGLAETRRHRSMRLTSPSPPPLPSPSTLSHSPSTSTKWDSRAWRTTWTMIRVRTSLLRTSLTRSCVVGEEDSWTFAWHECGSRSWQGQFRRIR